MNYSDLSRSENLRFRNILLRDFRTVKDGRVVNFNIGTAAHAPATLAVLEKYLPADVKITVWADAPLSADLAGMMLRRFPHIPIVYGDLEKNPSPELLEAVYKADIFLVSSGEGIPGSVRSTMAQFKEKTGKPAAAYGIGCTPGLLPLIDLLIFVWFRDPVAEKVAEHSACPQKGWAPDAVFDFDAPDVYGAEEFMKKHALEPGKFICCIPGQRYTPRWRYFDMPENQEKDLLNARFEEHDNAPLPEIIKVAVEEFGLKVLICPEQRTEIDLIRRLVYDRLTPEVQNCCIPMDEMWTPDVALGVYSVSCGVFGVEMHSQVMAVGQGVPAVLLRHPQFGSKSEMWKTLGLNEWLIDVESPDYFERAVDVARSILSNPEKSAAMLRRAREMIDLANRNAIGKSFFCC